MTNEELCIAIQSGKGNKQELFEQLFNQNIGMIEMIIRRYQGIEDIEDLRQESYFGIVKAAELWDPGREVLFMSYASYWINQVVQRYIDNCGAVVRVPVHRRAMLAKYRKTLNNYRMKFGQDPSERELCALMELTLEQLKDMKKDAAAVQILSTSAPIGGEADELTLEDTIADTSEPIEETIDRIQQEELSREIWACVDDLKPQHRDMIRKRYQDGRTLKECSEKLGCSVEYARRIEQDAIRELRKSKHVKQLRPFLTEQAAYSLGLRGNSVGSFRRNGSSSERAVILLERLSGGSLWKERKIYT